MKNKVTSSIILMLIVLTISCKDDNKVVKDNSNNSVHVEKVNTIDFYDQIYITGRISYDKEYKLSFKTSGIIDKILVNEGEQVKANQLLATLKLTEIQAKTEQAENALKKAERDYERTKELFNDSVATLEQLQNSETQLTHAKLDLETARFNLEHSKIIAPNQGIIQKVNANENEVIQAGTPVLVFGNNDSYKILKTNISDRDVVKINIGDSVIITSDPFPGTRFTGQVDEIAGMANAYTGTFELKIKVDDPLNQLRSGFISSAIIKSSVKQQLIQVPVESLISAEGKQGKVYVVVNQQAILKKVKIESISQDNLLISEGLKPQDYVVTSGVHKITGDTVSIKTN